MFVYQINDSIARMSATEETARSWDRLLAIAWTIMVPSGLHWAMFLTGKIKLANNLRFIIPSLFSLHSFFNTIMCGTLFPAIYLFIFLGLDADIHQY